MVSLCALQNPSSFTQTLNDIQNPQFFSSLWALIAYKQTGLWEHNFQTVIFKITISNIWGLMFYIRVMGFTKAIFAISWQGFVLRDDPAEKPQQEQGELSVRRKEHKSSSPVQMFW